MTGAHLSPARGGHADEDHAEHRTCPIGLRGIDSEPLHSFIWRGFPAGDYDVVGILLDDRGQEEVVVQAAMRVIVR